MKKIYLFIAINLFLAALHGQTAIDFRLPQAAGSAFRFVMEKGAGRDTDCGNCRNELHDLKEKYDLLKSNAIRIITVSADANKDEFEDTANDFPWTDKLCDFKLPQLMSTVAAPKAATQRR